MARYIDADRLINDFTNNSGVFVCGPKKLAAIVFRINTQPTANVAEVQEARWKGAGMGDYYCSLCQETVSGNKFKYCPYCGAIMDGGKAE